MTLTDRIAIIGHNGWAASRIVRALAAQPFDHPLCILARHGSSVSALPPGVELVRYSWDDESSLRAALEGVDVVISFVGPEGLKDQIKLIRPMQEAGVKLFVPSDLALPYTPEERRTVPVPRDKYEVELELERNGTPFVVICIGNFTSFALDSPYMGIDLPNHRIVHVGSSRQNPIWLCTLDYVAAGFVSIFTNATPSDLTGRLIGLNELRPTTLDIEQAMAAHVGRRPRIANEKVEEMARQAEAGRLDALVRKKMGDGTHSAVWTEAEVWVFEYPKVTLETLIQRSPLDDPPYVPQNEESLRFLDRYFE